MPNVASSVLSPGFYLSVNLVAGDQAVGSAPLKALLIAPKGSGGDITAGTEIRRAVAGPDAVSTAVGSGTPGHLAAKAIFKEHPIALVDLIATAEPSGNAATGTITLDDTTPVTVQQTLTSTICGRDITTQWPAGMTDTDAATAHVAEVNAHGSDLPVTAANAGGTSPVITFTAKLKGTWGNDVGLSVSLKGGTGGTAVASGAALSGGTTEMDVTTVLTTIAGTEYQLSGLATSNTDVASASSTSNPGRIKTSFKANATGSAAKLQQAVLGHTGALSAVKTGVAARNYECMEVVHARNMRSLPCELMGAELGARLREEAIDPDVNRSNRKDMPYRATLYTSKDLTTDAPTAAELEDALQSGVSEIVYTDLGEPFVSIPRTTYFKDSGGNTDHRLVFVSQVSSIYAVARDLRAFLPARFPKAKIVPTIVQGDDEIPPFVVDADTVRQVSIARVREWQKLGVVRKDKLDDAVKNGAFSVQVDSGNSSKLNIQIPLSIVPPLTIFDVEVLGV